MRRLDVQMCRYADARMHIYEWSVCSVYVYKAKREVYLRIQISNIHYRLVGLWWVAVIEAVAAKVLMVSESKSNRSKKQSRF